MLSWLRSFTIFVSRFVLSFYGIMIAYDLDRSRNLLQTLLSRYQVDSSIFKLFHNLTDGMMPSRDRKQQTTCSYCGKQVKIVNLSRHKKSCVCGTKSCPHVPTFSARLKPRWIISLLQSMQYPPWWQKPKAIFARKNIPASIHCKGTRNRYMVQGQEYKMVMWTWTHLWVNTTIKLFVRSSHPVKTF